LDDAAAQVAVQLLVQAARPPSATLVIATHDARVAQALASCLPEAPTLLQLMPTPRQATSAMAAARVPA
jgi:hypothetical protein